MDRKKVGVLFGGVSTEHDVSVVSGTSVIEKLDKEKYDVIPFYIAKDGSWYHYLKPVCEIKTAKMGEELQPLEKIPHIIEDLKTIDVAFPVLHGLGGEDGSIQGLFQMAQIPYVGCGILASSVGMDKVYTKIIFEKAGILQTKHEVIKYQKEKFQWITPQLEEVEESLEQIVKRIEGKLMYPMFVKPSNSGSSVGVKKAKTNEELKEAIQYASQFDSKILVEEGIQGREIECAVLGNQQVISSCVGEVLPAEEFYSFDAKYSMAESKTMIPADISKEISNQIRDLAIRAFKAIDGKGLARVDFFVEEKTNKIYINEINTMPGFTTISMYPKLFEQVGITYSNLLERLINLAMEN